MSIEWHECSLIEWIHLGRNEDVDDNDDYDDDDEDGFRVFYGIVDSADASLL